MKETDDSGVAQDREYVVDGLHITQLALPFQAAEKHLIDVAPLHQDRHAA